MPNPKLSDLYWREDRRRAGYYIRPTVIVRGGKTFFTSIIPAMSQAHIEFKGKSCYWQSEGGKCAE